MAVLKILERPSKFFRGRIARCLTLPATPQPGKETALGRAGCAGAQSWHARLVLVVLLAGPFAHAGSSRAAQTNIFGVQDRADAAKQMIVLAVQQGISSLPPTSSQSFSYEYDPNKDTYVRNQLLGPTVLRSPQTIGAGHFSVRLAASYFALSDSLGPTDYIVNGDPDSATRFGVDASAKVTLLNLAASYGLTNRIEINVSLPLVVTSAKASEVFLTRASSEAVVAVPPSLIDENLQNGQLVLRRTAFDKAGADFPEGTHSGVGRISIGGKALLYSGTRLRFALAPEFFFPSPNEDELAGSASAAILPRAIASVAIVDPLKVYVDAGYDYDFDHDELRRFVWTAGMSFATARASVDVGFGGSEFNQGIQWTPSSASYTTDTGERGTLTAVGRNRLGTSFVDFLFGLKLRLTEKVVLSGAVNAAVNDEGFRADAIGTLALELYL